MSRSGPGMIGSMAPDTPASRRGGIRRVRWLLGYAAPYRRRLLLGVAGMLAALAAGLAAPYLVKVAIDRGIEPGDTRLLVIVVLVMLGVGAVGLLAQAVESYMVGWVGERILADVRSDVYAHLQRLPLGFFERSRAGVLISRLTNDVDALQQLVTDGITSSARNALSLVGAAIILAFLDWRLALATLVVFPVMAAATVLYRRASTRAYRKLRERLGHVTAALQEDLNGVRVMQSFAREERNLARFRTVNKGYRDANQETVYANAIYFPAVELLSALATAIVFGYGGWLYIHGDVSLGTLVAFAGYLANFFDPVQALTQVYNTFLSASAALEKIGGVMEVEPDLVDAPGAVPLPPVAGRVTFDHVRFGYAADRPVVTDIHLDVPAGTTVALVGHTGAGKSTIVKLIARFYDPQAGAVLIDGHDLRGVTQTSLRGQLAIVPQEAFLFAGSVAENIAYGRPGASRDDVRAAAEAVGAVGFIDDLPEGFDTPLGERGARLSIGQRQLIAFARALLAEPRILILDEATSSVDLATEGRIEEALATLLAGRTAFVVAHRLSTIRSADLIVVLEHGAIVEQGSHDELIASGGRYRALYGDWLDAAAPPEPPDGASAASRVQSA